jgi:hypothetical protein
MSRNEKQWVPGERPPVHVQAGVCAGRRKRKLAKRAQRSHRRRPHVPERLFFIVNLLYRVRWIIEMIVVERPCAMGV